jgi:hypothetical protein
MFHIEIGGGPNRDRGERTPVWSAKQHHSAPNAFEHSALKR